MILIRLNQNVHLSVDVGVGSVSEDTPIIKSTVTPMVGLLVQGGPLQIDHVYELLNKKVPVVVMKGTGLAADLIAFGYQEMFER